MANFAFVGKMGAGKSTAAQTIMAEHENSVKVPMAKCLRDVYNLLWPGEPFNRWKMQELGRLLRHIDEDCLVNYAYREMERISFNLDGEVEFVVDDVRYPNEWQRMREWDFIIVRVTASRAHRVTRLRQNGKLQDESELEHETETALDGDEFDADFTINNDGSLTELYEAVKLVDYTTWRRS